MSNMYTDKAISTIWDLSIIWDTWKITDIFHNIVCVDKNRQVDNIGLVGNIEHLINIGFAVGKVMSILSYLSTELDKWPISHMSIILDKSTIFDMSIIVDISTIHANNAGQVDNFVQVGNT